jgi:hypothetical protein
MRQDEWRKGFAITNTGVSLNDEKTQKIGDQKNPRIIELNWREIIADPQKSTKTGLFLSARPEDKSVLPDFSRTIPTSLRIVIQTTGFSVFLAEGFVF